MCVWRKYGRKVANRKASQLNFVVSLKLLGCDSSTWLATVGVEGPKMATGPAPDRPRSSSHSCLLPLKLSSAG